MATQQDLKIPIHKFLVLPILEKNKKMRLLLLLFFILFTLNSQGQLRSIFFNKNEIDKNKDMLFHQFNFKLRYYKGERYITSLKSDSILFKPPKKSFYETYNNEYLISTAIDNRLIPKATSTAFCFYPRKYVYIIPIGNIENLTSVYCVNFNKRIIMEDFDFELDEEYKFFKINKIDTENMKITISDKENKSVILDLKVKKL